MKLQFNRLLISILETGSVILLLIWGDGISIPSSLRSAFNPITYLIVAILILTQFKRSAYFATKDISLLLLVGLAGFSILWSENIAFSIDYFRAIVRTTLLGVYVAVRYSPREQMWLFFLTGIIVTTLSLVVGFTVPSESEFFLGIYAHKNYLARIMIAVAITSLLATFDVRRYRWATITVFSLAVIVLLLSEGKTGLAIFLLSLSLVPCYQLIVKQHYKLRVVIFTISLILLSCLAVLILGNLETIVVDWMGKDLEFNGRTPIWERVIPKIGERPWLGYGIHGFWSSDEGIKALRGIWMGNQLAEGIGGHAHNGYLDILLSLGLVGMLLFIISITGMLRRLLLLLFITQKIEYFWMLELIFISQMYQIAEVITILTNNYLWAFYVSISLSSIVYLNRHKREKLARKPSYS
ncbi:MAG: O-antigen ligase family protein [Cyanobacteria bacterium P01_G01_bin.39]